MIYPMFAMVLLTFLVAFRLLFLRLKAIKTGSVKLSQFRLNTGEMPDEIAQTARNYSNLFEIPVLFYAAGATAIAMGTESTAMMVAAWLFVFARTAHSIIHLTINDAINRFRTYAFGNLCVLAIWGILLIDHATHYVG
ncbi:MAPEG family protein [Cellvibrio sp. QJXJ]|uniref:MAPEG family protein n=1 Tax=Cellvibrio sp. QJXJ TaxID=2964606 RepID=UPI0021C2BD49|nr:MAPEG family protein [Cellvibrio sp. QJXJ]UUA72981.1 MAPEG family protein [Cellvibrio sp. QJXJ]